MISEVTVFKKMGLPYRYRPFIIKLMEIWGVYGTFKEGLKNDNQTPYTYLILFTKPEFNLPKRMESVLMNIITSEKEAGRKNLALLRMVRLRPKVHKKTHTVSTIEKKNSVRKLKTNQYLRVQKRTNLDRYRLPFPRIKEYLQEEYQGITMTPMNNPPKHNYLLPNGEPRHNAARSEEIGD